MTRRPPAYFARPPQPSLLRPRLSMHATDYTNTSPHYVPPMLPGIIPERPAAHMQPADPKASTFPLPDWLRLFLVAAMLDILRRFSAKSLEHISQACWVTVSFDDEDACYSWILYWLSRHPSWQGARFVQATTRTFGVLSQDACTVPQQVDRKGAARTLSYMPSTQARHTMWYNGCYTVVRRESLQDSEYIRRESLHMSFLTRNNSVIGKLLAEAKQCYVDAQNDSVSIYIQDSRTYSSRAWRQVTSRPKRPLESIVLERGIKEKLLSDARQFLDSAEWYAQRGIPYRRGYLLHGAPGSGKTSVIQSLAGELSLDVYVLTLNRAGLDDTTLNQLVAELPRRCIALIEDIDAVFHQGVSRRTPEEEASGERHDSSLVSQGRGGDKRDAAQCRVSLSGLLNALDGIGAQDGRILFATTNHYAALDPALIRPGRMDLHFEFKLASKEQAQELFYRFYMPEGENRDDPAETPYLSDDDINAQGEDLPFSPPPSPRCDLQSAVGDALCRVATDSNITEARLRLHRVAKQFARAIPDRRFSMASLQGYLMLYKDQPHEAVVAVVSWVDQETEKSLCRT